MAGDGGGPPAPVASGQHGEVAAVTGTQDRKVPAVQRQQTRRVPLGCEDHERRVSDTDVLIAVALHNPRGLPELVDTEKRKLPSAPGELGQGGQLRVDAPAGAEEVVELGDDVRGDDERPFVCFDHVGDLAVVPIARVEVSDEPAGVHDEHGSAFAEARQRGVDSFREVRVAACEQGATRTRGLRRRGHPAQRVADHLRL